MPKETLQDSLKEFFDTSIDNKTFAQYMRRYMHEVTCMSLLMDEDTHTPDNEVIWQGYYFLNELCERLDPYMKKDSHT